LVPIHPILRLHRHVPGAFHVEAKGVVVIFLGKPPANPIFPGNTVPSTFAGSYASG
jgi:hypothetical protein